MTSLEPIHVDLPFDRIWNHTYPDLVLNDAYVRLGKFKPS
jgi:hypothetical protein